MSYDLSEPSTVVMSPLHAITGARGVKGWASSRNLKVPLELPGIPAFLCSLGGNLIGSGGDELRVV